MHLVKRQVQFLSQEQEENFLPGDSGNRLLEGDDMKNIVLIGFMGTGKTSTGRLLASRLGRPFIDVDRKLELECNMTIAELFSGHGEAVFKQKEQSLISRLARYHNSVIATGGTVVDQEVLTRLRLNGIIISLSASVETIVERTGRRKGIRPLLDCDNPAEVVAALLAKRSFLYQSADYSIDTSSYSPHQVVEKIILFLRQSGYLRGRS